MLRIPGRRPRVAFRPSVSVRIPPRCRLGRRPQTRGAIRHASADRICRSPVGSSRRDDPVSPQQCHGRRCRGEARARRLCRRKPGRARNSRRAGREHPRTVRTCRRRALAAGFVRPYRGPGTGLRGGQLLADLPRLPHATGGTARGREAGDRLARRRRGDERLHPCDRRSRPTLRIGRRWSVDAGRGRGPGTARGKGVARGVARRGHRCR